MWLQKQDIKLWASLALASVSDTPMKVAENHEQDLATPQIGSPSEVEIPQDLDDDCLECWENYYCFECLVECVYRSAPFVGPDGERYCREHYDALFSEVDSEEFA